MPAHCIAQMDPPSREVNREPGVHSVQPLLKNMHGGDLRVSDHVVRLYERVLVVDSHTESHNAQQAAQA